MGSFNESWGIQDVYVNDAQQKFTEAIYYLTKTYDSMRPVVTNDGWEHTISDIITSMIMKNITKYLRNVMKMMKVTSFQSNSA